MALVSKTVFSATAMDAQFTRLPGEECFVEMVYDNVDLMVRSLRLFCSSLSAFPFWYQVSRPDRTRTRFGVVNPGTDITISVSTTQAQRLQLFVGDNGKVAGLEGDFAYPAP